MPRISVIVPVYNVEEYISTCLKSLINQTLKDIEIICVNDGSTDSSVNIIKSFMKSDSRIKLINSSNMGQGIARNIGIKNSIGEYIAFVDPDDWIDYEMFYKMYEQANSLNSDIVICNYIRWFEDSNKSQSWPFFEKVISSTQNETLDIPEKVNLDKSTLYSTLLISPCYSWNRIYKRDLILKNDILFATTRCYEDCIFILKSHILAKSVSYINEPLYKYRRHTNSTLSSLNNRVELLLDEYNSMKNYLSNVGMLKTLDLNLRYFLVMNLIYTYRNSNAQIQKDIVEIFSKILTPVETRQVKNKLKYGKLIGVKKIIKKIFSLENCDGHKVLIFAGIKFKFRHIHLNKYEKEAKRKINRILKQSTKKYIKEKFIFFDCLYDTKTESIDAFSQYLFMYSQGYKAYYIVDIKSPFYLYLKNNNLLNINIIVLKNSYSERPDLFIEALTPYLLNAKCILTSFGLNTPWLEEFFIKLTRGNYIFLQHGVIYLKESILKNGYLPPNRFNKILTSSTLECSLLKKYGWTENQFIQCGLPRWDLLPKTQTKSTEILIFFTWRRSSNPLFQKSLYYKNLVSLLNNKRLQDLLESNNITIYFAAHHALLSNQEINLDINIPNIKYIDISENLSEYIKRCSCLITDFSSVAFDFMFQEKPVLFYMLDYNDPHLNYWDRKDLDKFEGYKKYSFENSFFDEKTLIDKLEQYINNKFSLEENIKEQYNRVFFTKENIRKKLAQKLKEL